MSKEDILNKLFALFPIYKGVIKSYKKIGSRCILFTYMKPVEIMKIGNRSVYVPGGKSNMETLMFLYNNDNDWTLGTKVWRMKPQGKKEESDITIGKPWTIGGRCK